MLTVNIDTFNAARKLLEDPDARAEGLQTLRKILDIKEHHLWRSEAMVPCCGSLGDFTCRLDEETSLLRQALSLVEKGDLKAASPLLDRVAKSIIDGMGAHRTPGFIDPASSSPRREED